MTIHPITRRDLLTLLAILLMAAFLRLGEPGIVEFFHDEAMVSTLAQEMADGETFPVQGILSSVGIPNPPTSIYIMAVPYTFTSDPLIATLYVAVLNVIGVGLLWLIVHRYFGRIAALVAGLVYTFNPWAVLYSRKIWAQDYYLPFFMLALLMGLYGFVEEGERNRSRLAAQVLCLPLLLFALQIHFAAWALLPLYFWLLWIGRKRISWRAMLMSVFLSAIVMLPYAVGFSQTLEQDPARIGDVAARSEATDGLSLSGDTLTHAVQLATGLGLETWVAPAHQDDLLAQIPPPSALWMLVGMMTLAGVIGVWRNYPRSLAIILLLWAGLPLLLFLPGWTAVYPHYFIAGIPAFGGLAGVGAAWLAERWPRIRYSRVVLLAGLTVILFTQGFWWRGLLRYLDSTPLHYPGFTTPVHYLNDVHDELALYDDVLLVSAGMDWIHHHEAARWPVMLRDTARCVRTVQGDGYAVFPAGTFAVLVAPNAPENAVGNLYETTSPVFYPTRPGDGGYTVYAFESAPEWTETPIAPIAPATFDSGVQLTGYHTGEGRLYLEWMLPDTHKDLNYQYFAHFLNADGELIAQYDTPFWQGRHWCAGDRLITWTDVDSPGEATTLRVGLYTLGTGRTEGQYFSADVLDDLGNPAGQWVDITVKN